MSKAIDYIIIGNGIAGTTAAEAIRKSDPDGSIAIFSDEAYPFYARIRLPQFLAGDVTLEKIVLKSDSWYQEHNIDLHINEPVVDINPTQKLITTNTGGSCSYKKLLLATGSHSFVLPLKGIENEGVFTLRNIDDAIRIKEYIRGKKNAVILGGGLLGLEVGKALICQGVEITVIEYFDRLLPRQVDLAGSNMLKCMMEKIGYHFHLGLHAEEIIRENGKLKVLMHEGDVFEGDMVLVSAGVRPNLDLAEKAGVNIDKGIIVDDHLKTSVDGIFAAGDLTQHKERLYGIWPAAKQQGEIAGMNMAGVATEYTGSTVITALKVAGINLTSIGDIDLDNTKECVVDIDNEHGTYKKYVMQESALVGCILVGDTKDKKKIERAIIEKRSIDEVT